MRAWAISQIETLTPVEMLAGVVIGILALALILWIFPKDRRASGRPAPQKDAPLPGDGPLASIIAAAGQKMVDLARTKEATAGIFHFGAVDIHPRHLAYWITTATDAQRDRLAADSTMQDEFRRILMREGYPAEAVPEVGFAFQSEETVQRDYGGNWFHAVK